MYLISAYFDANTNKILQRYIDQIADQTGNRFMTENHVPPHMTISQIEARNVEVLMPYMQVLSGQLKKEEIRFVSVGMLLPYVLYATPVLNQYLQDLSLEIYKNFSEVAETTISNYYKPMSWLPHVTLGKTLSKEQMQIAVQIMQNNFAPFTAKITEFGLAKVNPHVDVIRF